MLDPPSRPAPDAGAFSCSPVTELVGGTFRVGVPPPGLETFPALRSWRITLRRQLNALVAAHHHRTGLPHGKIHAELRRLCGGPPSAQATIDQLDERIAIIRTL
jgi:hypothetical protein